MGPSVDPVLRFSMWFNTGVVVEQKITNHVALVSGLNLRNVGLINKIDSIKLKQRVYSTGVPLAIRFGDLNKKVNVTLGAEAEFFLNYKVKEFVFDEKIYKSNEWLSDNVELFNPSVFAQFQFGNSLYIRFKYYLNNFLKECANQTGTVNTPCTIALKLLLVVILSTHNYFICHLVPNDLTRTKRKNRIIPRQRQNEHPLEAYKT
jgi:hypothetical protein